MYKHGGTLPGSCSVVLHTYYHSLLTSDVHGEKHHTYSNVHLLRLFSTKNTARRVNASVLISKLKHRLTQCLSRVRSKFTVTIQYITSGLRYYNTIRSVTHLILLLTIYLRIYPILLLTFWQRSDYHQQFFSEGPQSASVWCSTTIGPHLLKPP